MAFLRQRAPLLAVLLIGLVAWRGSFGVFAFERTVVFRLPVPYADVRSVELQIWSDDGLLRRERRETPTGLMDDPRLQVALKRGAHRAIATTQAVGADGGAWQVDFDPGWDEIVTVAPAR